MTYGSLFTGIGGIDLGLDRAGLQCRWQVENDPYAIRVLEKHWPEVTRYGDITKVNGSELEPVDLICGGFPCQDLSQAGKRIGIEGSRSGLWFEYARIVGVVRPRFVLIENVPGLLVPTAMSRVVGELARLGYVGAWRSLRASEFGAAHLRKRVFIVAYREVTGTAAGTDEWEEHQLHDWRGVSSRPGTNGPHVADGTLRGLGELREPSGCNGLPDGSHEALGNRDFASANSRSPAGGSWRATRESGGHLADPINRFLQKQGRGPEGRDGAGSGSPVLDDAANGRGISLRPADGQRASGAALRPGEQLEFAPGPSDPRWPAILRERPDLAPALAYTGHAKRAERGSEADGLQLGTERQSRSESASPDEPGTAPPESPFRGVVHGIPNLTHGGLNDDQVGSEKSRTKAGKNRRVPALRCDGKTPAASSGLLQAARRDDPLPAVPHRTADEGRHLGERSEESEGLQNMRQELHAASLQKPYDLQPGVPAGDRAAERDAPLAFTGPDENMPVVPDGIPVCAPAPDDLQQKLRQQTGVGEQAYWDEQIRLAMSNRTKRLGRLGNAVVPQIAEWLGRRILEFEEERK